MKNIQKSIIIFYISQESFDYDLLLNYLRVNPLITKLNIIPQGLLAETIMPPKDRKNLIQTIIQSDVNNIYVYDILHEEINKISSEENL